MTPSKFVFLYKNYAKEVEADTGICAVTILTRAAIESGWGELASGYNFFGIKDTDGVNGNEQLITTTEYMTSPSAKFPVILKIIPFGKKMWKYTVKDYFRKYDSPKDSFQDFAEFILKNSRYKNVVTTKNPIEQGIEICKAGYATDPNSVELTRKVSIMIFRLM